jgi:HEAT repeat protein
MHARIANQAAGSQNTLLQRGARLLLLLLPAGLLTISCLRYTGPHAGLLWLGVLFQLLACALVILGGQGLRDLSSTAVIMLYVIALGWLLLGGAGWNDWYRHLAEAILLVVPLLFFGLQALGESGAPALRRARSLAQRLRQRRDWPADPQACRLLPEVKALRDALYIDASPALGLLGDARPHVRVAALAALEYRQSWRPGQAEVVLQLAQKAVEPEVRAAAVNALANVEDRLIVEALAELLHDPSPLVRQTTGEALLWNTENNWSWIRVAVRRALGDPVAQSDGPLRHSGSLFTNEAIADLTAWASEKGLLALRSSITLGQHYNQVLTLGGSPQLVDDLRRQLTDVHAPAMLRLELARVLHQHRELDAAVFRQLLDASNPTPLRMMAVEALLAMGDSVEAVAALHELARLPNREIALHIAEVVQRRLGVDMGLPRNEPLPSVHSRLAAEVARRVLAWASLQEFSAEEPQGIGADDPSWAHGN